MNSISGQLSYIDTLIYNYLDSQCANKYHNEIGFLRSKSQDQKLYLAVVGEFSSGKSTFINALINMRILKEAVMPTTACATYIERGDKFEIRVKFSTKKQSFYANETNLSSITTFLNQTYNKKVNSILNIIEILTSDSIVANHVEKLNIWVPSTSLPSNVVLIDTPGFNPGGQAFENHFEVTQNVVKNFADMAIILMPSDQPFSASVNKFLGDYLQRCLHRCVFVLTKMDNIDNSNSRDEIKTYVINSLKSNFGLVDPMVYGESAITVLPVVRIPDSKLDMWKVWQREFKTFESKIWTKLSLQKDIIIAEHLNTLLYDLLKDFKKTLMNRQKELKNKVEFLNKSKVEHISSVTTKMLDQINVQIDRFFLGLISEVENKIVTEKAKTINFVDTNVTSDRYYKIENELIPQISGKCHQNCTSLCNEINGTLRQKAQNLIDYSLQELQNGFKRHYSMFPSIRKEPRLYSIEVSNITKPNISFEVAKQKINNAGSEGGKKALGTTGKYTALGAGVGSVIPGLGTLLGAGVGAGIGLVKGFLDAIDIDDEAFPAVKSSIINEVTNYYETLKNKYKTEISNTKSSIKRKIQQYSYEYLTTYGSDVEMLIKKQQDDITSIKKLIINIKQDIINIEDLTSNVQLNISTLKSK